jgi:hypothetical protein
MAYTTINKPSEYFNTKLYTGTGAENVISDIGFNPDFVWFKKRSDAEHHFIYDQVRGALKKIAPSNTNPQSTETQTLKSFDTGGYTLGTSGEVNGSATTYVAWNWLGGGTGVSNTDGDIASTVSANTTSGFSIVTWSGTSSNGTIGHGLGVAPKVIICFGYSSGGNSWTVGHNSLSWNHIIYLETGAASTVSNSAFWQNTAPTNDVFSVGSFSGINSSQSMIAYCFAEKKGYSKFGSYTGNGNADGTFVYTGFKPALLIRKRTDASNDWYINDNKRAGYNPQNDYLFPNTTQAESALQRFDFLSNGFKIRTTDGGDNASGGTYIYMAFAEEPLVGTNNIPTTAR